MTKEEAINEIRSWDFLNGKEIEAVQTLIPELRESEDERVRKKLIETIGYFRSKGIDQQLCEEFLTYLEKQKEQKPVEDSDFKTKLAEYMTKNSTEHSFSISSESILQMAEEELIKRGVVQKPAEWSEEDEFYLGVAISMLKAKKEDGQYAQYILDETETWLKSRHPQPKQEWSEKDKKILDDVSHILIGLNYKQIAKDYKQVVEKSIYARPSWKPSKEQMDALHEAVIRSCSHRYGVKLLNLEVDLLNLK